jgi:LemA protein
MSISGIVVLVILVAAVFFVGIYDKLVVLKNRYKNAFSQIEVQLKRRYDLIPNLVETAKAYMAHERELHICSCSAATFFSSNPLKP